MKFLWLGFEKNRSMDILVSPTAELPSHHITTTSSSSSSSSPLSSFHHALTMPSIQTRSLSNLTHLIRLHQHTNRAKRRKTGRKRREKKELKGKKPDSSKCHRRVGGRRIATLELSKLVTAHSKTCKLGSKLQKNCSLHFSSIRFTAPHLTSPFPFKFID